MTSSLSRAGRNTQQQSGQRGAAQSAGDGPQSSTQLNLNNNAPLKLSINSPAGLGDSYLTSFLPALYIVMVFYRESPAAPAPLSRILPHLYLGAETDVTQDCLSAQGISYVLSVSRCCPQPSFLPQSQYLRIPIDDSLRDDLLPWIPQALRFIDGAMSLGCSVIVHCAAGISRSPALAVAYVMYSLGMDLDHAYRFVKERRPTISPNFNFLGQLQLFQGTLPLKSGNGNQSSQQPISSSDTYQQSVNKTINSDSTVGQITSVDVQEHVTDKNRGIKGRTEITKDAQQESKKIHMEAVLTPKNPKPEFTLSLSDKLRTLTLNVEPADVQRPASITPPAQQKTTKPQKPTHLQIPSLSDRRKSLTLSLTPVCPSPQIHQKGALQTEACTTPLPQKGDSGGPGKTTRHNLSAAEPHRPVSNEASTRCSSSRSQKRRSERKKCSSQNRGRDQQPKPNKAHQRGDRVCRTVPSKGTQRQRSAAVHQQEALERELAGCAVEAVEGTDGDQSPMSPINLSINRLLGWGERMLLGVLLGPHIKVGQAALPYRC